MFKLQARAAPSTAWSLGSPLLALGLTVAVGVLLLGAEWDRDKTTAVGEALDRAGLTIEDIDVVELNEAFAAQVLPIADEVGIDMEKLNPHGGAIALGHPFGMTGVRMMATLINDLETLDGRYGIETMCVAQGQGEAMIIERVS